MPRQVTLADGRTVEVECLSCALTSGLIEPTGGVIYESRHFHVHQDVAYPIRGLVIIASKRHFYCMDELTSEEQLDFISIIHKVRSEQRNSLGIDKVYYFYNEDTTHHFHLWMVPRYEWMYSFGNSVESLRPVLVHARNNMNTESNMLEVLNGINTLRLGLEGFVSNSG
ncbi:diadenosine tetraphosphate hydrolase [Paenibacillus timonensis]|jgi:diadenosine tetraphosphate (Ap4A) HIT family hydrolase|uniref:HIT family protein n=1 Tax=Paenibacillus timonensis TaxID=225915 RepID=A0ABW3SIK5_9BACL|nr:diadenosine tetraphosphate hydrolase [Paenibacillus timonensis]EBK2060122.1 diadenosine tetraphosphate hydrolase [Salmonella enterica subsp. enterica serovar Typhi]MCH1643113.1 diadenosine tetraphosphate hydrolase [Paenibacillus timonensis]